MKTRSSKRIRCAIYTRVSTDQGLEQDFNSLDAQYDASEAYIRSQAHGRARPRQGCDRRTPSTWHGSCPPRRPACRMVPPAPDAWASRQIAAHSNRVSADCGLRCRETGSPGQRKMRQYVTRTTDQRSQRPSGRIRSPPIRGLSQPLQEISATAGWKDSNLQPDRYEGIWQHTRAPQHRRSAWR
jgi:hypothetical protein